MALLMFHTQFVDKLCGSVESPHISDKILSMVTGIHALSINFPPAHWDVT